MYDVNVFNILMLQSYFADFEPGDMSIFLQ